MYLRSLGFEMETLKQGLPVTIENLNPMKSLVVEEYGILMSIQQCIILEIPDTVNDSIYDFD